MRLRLPLHGRSHLPQGSDPLDWSGFIRYVFNNIGKWLYVETTDDVPPGHDNVIGAGMLFHDTGGTGIVFWSDNPLFGFQPVIGITPTGWLGYLDGASDLVYTQGGDFLRYSGGGGILLYTTDGGLPYCGDVLITTTGSSDPTNASGAIQLDTSSNGSGGGNDITLRSGRDVFVEADGNVEISITTGNALTVKDNGGNPIFRVDEDGDIHIGTGKTITADL